MRNINLRMREIVNAPVNGFYNLITNPATSNEFWNTEKDLMNLILNSNNGLVSEVTPDSPFGIAYDYLHSILRGNNGGPFCPFVKAIERNDAYYIKDFRENISAEMLINSATELVEIFTSVSPLGPDTYSHPDLTSCVAVFSSMKAQTLNGFQLMSHAHELLRPRVINSGLMLAVTHRLHEVGGRPNSRNPNEPMFVSKIPLFILRRMNRYDHVFMKSDADRESYHRLFGEL
jgi:hypothetical protein